MIHTKKEKYSERVRESVRERVIYHRRTKKKKEMTVKREKKEKYGHA